MKNVFVRVIVIEFVNLIKYIKYDIMILVYMLKGDGVRVKVFNVLILEDCKYIINMY